MQWLVDTYANNKLDKIFKFRISKSGKNYGTICMPTGTGKSGVIIEDIIYRIKNRCKLVIINVSCPTLKLSQQITSDLFDTLDGIFTFNSLNLSRNEVVLILNSSDKKNNYNTRNCSICKDCDLETVINSVFKNNKQVVIIASCHKSLQKFSDIVVNFKNIDIYNYIDESHLISYDRWDNNIGSGKYCLKQIKNNSKGFFLFSATPDFQMTKDFSDNSENPYLYKLYPVDAINENIILPPRIRCVRCDKSTMFSAYMNIMNECRAYGGYRKILVTLHDTNRLRELRNYLEKIGVKVFSASSVDGFTGTSVNNIVDFADVIDAWNGDCFVLQIKQLIQGADIRTLTDCVMPVSNEASSKTYRNLIQIMGRVLRAAPGERGKTYNQRTKKAGNIFFVLTPDSDLFQETCLRRFALRYYGMECALYGTEFRTPAEMTYEIESTKNSIRKNINEKKEIIKISIKYFKSSSAEEAAKILKIVDSYEYFQKDKSSIPEYHLLDNRCLLEYAENLIRTL